MKLDRWSGGEERAGRRGTQRRGRTPTPIFVSPRVAAVLAVLGGAVLAYVLYAAPSILVVALGGTALAVVLSFPVRALSHVMPRGPAILLTFLGLLGMVALALGYLVPLLVQQMSRLIVRTPDIANSANRLLIDTIAFLDERELLPGSDPEAFGRELVTDLFDRAQNLTENLLRDLIVYIPQVFNFGIILFAVLFVAAYLLVDVRKVKAAYLRAAPRRYRHDARDLWDAFGVSLSRYLGGLLFVAVVQGVLAGVALWVLGVPFALLLGVWVSITAIIPYLGAFLGAIPAVVLAFFQSPTTGILALVAYVLIQQLEGNYLTPRIQGQALHVHPILVLLAVIGGGQLAGLAGVIFAVPTLAVLRVFYDFFRARVRTSLEAEAPPS
ncbi:MAG TPA: AI-2E family transporter [Rubrobacteraceae bacterium]|nr:AI-2E family transporter [Rubrobacteraceae bacterium]